MSVSHFSVNLVFVNPGLCAAARPSKICLLALAGRVGSGLRAVRLKHQVRHLPELHAARATLDEDGVVAGLRHADVQLVDAVARAPREVALLPDAGREED